MIFRGHAFECRINAEDARTFMPSPGKITNFHAPGGFGIRVDSHLYSGYSVPPHYDSMIAKLISYGKDRENALRRMNNALDELIIEGIKTNIDLQKDLVNDSEFERRRCEYSLPRKETRPLMAGPIKTRHLPGFYWASSDNYASPSEFFANSSKSSASL